MKGMTERTTPPDFVVFFFPFPEDTQASQYEDNPWLTGRQFKEKIQRAIHIRYTEWF